MTDKDDHQDQAPPDPDAGADGITPAFTFHELRDTFASHLVVAGVPLLTVSKLLGHKDVRTTEKYYAHLAPSHLKEAMEKLPAF